MASVMRLGLIVNPIAGLAGSVALKGTDCQETVRRSLALGAQPAAEAKAERFLGRLQRHRESIHLLVGAGCMGADSARRAGFDAAAFGEATRLTTAADTHQAAASIVRQGCDILVFAGGDGTARDIIEAVGNRFPILGIPAGVKMHSGVFAISPVAAACVIETLITGVSRVEFRDMEVMDAEEAALFEGRISPRIYGTARVPFERFALQGPKRQSRHADAALDWAAAELIREMTPGTTYLLGPGTTTRRIKRQLGIEGTLLGVDAFLDRRSVGLDLRADALLALAKDRPGKIILGVTGGQGFILGRGNQQLSPALIRRVGRENLIIVASVDKLLALEGGLLRVDSGEAELDWALAGYIRVVTGPGETMMTRIAHPL
jgi:predicted polyphosphate/ATP-dependent NAD kinase